MMNFSLLTYRVYVLNDDGRIARSFAFKAGSDDEALQIVDQQYRFADMELWQLGRMVKAYGKKRGA